MTQPEEQQHKGQQSGDEATTPVPATPSETGGSEPTAAFEPTSQATPASPASQTSPTSPTSPAAPSAPESPATSSSSVWGEPPASPADQPPWGQPPTSPAAPTAWGQPPTSPAAPTAWGQPQAGPAAAPGSPAAQTPSGPGQSGVPLPPGWGQQPGQPGDPNQQQPSYQTPQDPFHTTTMTPTSAQLPYNPYGQLGPDGRPVPQPGFTPEQMLAPAPKKKSKALLITSIVLGVVLLLCAAGGVGAYLLVNNSEGTGAETAKDAAQGFLTAVYKEHDGTAAEKLVCNEARDRKAIDAKIKEIENQKASLKGPSITWDTPKIENETAEQADTTITIKLTTSDEKLAEQTLKLTLVKHDGWFVCEVQEQKK